MTTAKNSIDIPVEVCKSELKCPDVEFNRLFIIRLQAINNILTRKENNLVKDNQLLKVRLDRICEDFQKMNDHVERIQQSVNVVRSIFQKEEKNPV